MVLQSPHAQAVMSFDYSFAGSGQQSALRNLSAFSFLKGAHLLRLNNTEVRYGLEQISASAASESLQVPAFATQRTSAQDVVFDDACPITEMSVFNVTRLSLRCARGSACLSLCGAAGVHVRPRPCFLRSIAWCVAAHGSDRPATRRMFETYAASLFRLVLLPRLGGRLAPQPCRTQWAAVSAVT